MNIFKKIYCRTFQGIFRLALPILPYKQPIILKSNKEVCEAIKSNNKKNALFVTDNGIYSLGLTKNLEETLKENKIHYTLFFDVVPNPTTKNVESALKVFKTKKCDCIIAFGGGSVMDCAKAVGARAVYPNKSLAKMKGVMKVKRQIPLLIAVPTTAGTGSETTLTAVITDGETRHKYTINSFPLIPSYALLDASLTVGLPKHITSTTGMDALTHAIEAYIGRTTTKETRKASLEAIKLVFDNLLKVYKEPSNLKARQNMLEGAFKAGVAFTQSYVGYVHAIAHSLGGEYNIAHGLANAVILPYVLKAYGKSAYKKLWEIGLYLNIFDKNTTYKKGAQALIEKIERLNKELEIPTSIEQINAENISKLAKTAEKEANPLYPVPKLFTAKELEKIYYQVKEGKDE